MAHLNPHRTDDDQVYQRYLDRAIRDINDLGSNIESCGYCEHDDEQPGRVLGTGHPLADIMLLKYAPTRSELDHGVAFHGRAGDVVIKSVERLRIDPIDIYGTNCIKCSTEPTQCMQERCPRWLAREFDIVKPRLLVIMGEAARSAVNAIEWDAAFVDEVNVGNVVPWRTGCDVLLCPDIETALDRPALKQAFWTAFRQVGEWYAERPPW